MVRYIGLLDRDENAFGVVFPDAPGATAMGETQDDALQNASEALAEWVADRLADGLEVPRARRVEELLGDPDVGRALASGSVLAMVPLLQETGRAVRANISLDAGLLADIDEAASRVGLTRSAFLSSAAREKIKAGA